MRLLSVLLLVLVLGESAFPAEPEFPLTEDSKPHADIPHGKLITETFRAKEGSVFPGTEREYTIYQPPGYDNSRPSPFMIFQDGVIYNAPVVFDNLIAKKQIPPLIGIFIKPGVVPAANPNALPRYNRSYEYDSVTDTYSRFLLDEFLPALEAKHGIKLSTDPNDAAIAGNSSGGICAFMAAWHRPERIRRVFSGVGTYVGIHGADQLPVLVRKYEPKPLRIYLQSGTGDNSLYCGDWWMANQTLERALTWAGYDVNHTWGEGGHNQKHATQIFPDVLRWLWRDYATAKEIKPNPRGDSKWKGYEVIGEGKWEQCWEGKATQAKLIAAKANGDVFSCTADYKRFEGVGDPVAADAVVIKIPVGGPSFELGKHGDYMPACMAVAPDGKLYILKERADGNAFTIDDQGEIHSSELPGGYISFGLCFTNAGDFYYDSCNDILSHGTLLPRPKVDESYLDPRLNNSENDHRLNQLRQLALSPDQTTIYAANGWTRYVSCWHIRGNRQLTNGQAFCYLEAPYDFDIQVGGLCVDTNGWLYVATALGIQVCDQAGRVNFIIPTPQQPHDICFGGKDLGELFIACGDKIYKRPTKAHGIVSGQMAPIKPPAPKL